MNKSKLDKFLDSIPIYKSPKWFQIFIAKILIRTFKLIDLQNDIVLFNELRLWIETEGRPTTSNPNYWINKEKQLIK